jgi:methionyl-tRNA formyltransferase
MNKIILCAFGRAGLEIFYQLINELNVNPRNILVFTHEASENKSFINHLKNLEVSYFFDSINQKLELVKEFNPEYLFSIYYRNIISSEILKIVSYRAINAHPSLLPDYKGTMSSVWAILNGEKITGITYHFMNSGIDTGNILHQNSLEIYQNDTAFSLYNRLISLFISNFSKMIDKLKSGDIGVMQDKHGRYYKRSLPHNGELKFSDVDFEYATRFVRAMYFPPFKGALFIDNKNIKHEIKKVEDLIRFKNQLK